MNGDYPRGNTQRQNYRRAKRRRIEGVVPVIDAMTETTIGRVGNLSESGMLLIASQPLVDDALYQLRFSLPDGTGGHFTVEAGLHALWLDQHNAAGQTWVGLRIISIPDDQLAAMRLWLEAPGARYD